MLDYSKIEAMRSFMPNTVQTLIERAARYKTVPSNHEARIHFDQAVVQLNKIAASGYSTRAFRSLGFGLVRLHLQLAEIYEDGQANDRGAEVYAQQHFIEKINGILNGTPEAQREFFKDVGGDDAEVDVDSFHFGRMPA